MRGSDVLDTVSVSGGLLPSGLLERIGAQDSELEAVAETDYFLAPGERLGEAITRSWNRLLGIWERFAQHMEDEGALTGPTRQEWLLPLFQELGFGQLQTAPGFEIEDKAYAISHVWEWVPIHLVGVGVPIDRRSPGVPGAASASPHGLVQEFLNRSEEHQWGVVSNGRLIRLLRDNASLTRTSFVEFDLEEMFEGEVFSDFALLWLTCHASRLEGPAGKQLIERWREDAARHGVRALDALRDGVESAIKILGADAVGHPKNGALRSRLESGHLSAQDLYWQLLRVIYRLLFLLVSESRGLLLDTGANTVSRNRYESYYSVSRLRDLARQTRGTNHPDLWHQLNVVARTLEHDGEPSLALPALGGFLWSSEAVRDLEHLQITNHALLGAVRALTTVNLRDGVSQRVDYANLGAEELGSIYESLLEYVPEVNPVAGIFELKVAAGNERKTTGSYYTPTSLINELLNSALDPVVDEAAQANNPEQAILELKVVDPAAGSGHFLIAAANRIADRLARIRSGDEEPSPDQLRTALRDVISHCIYAVDINPMAVELAKVALWIEAMQPGRPLTFLDHHIVCGNSLLGVTPKLLEEGIPGAAYKALTGDDKDIVKALKARNRKENKGKSRLTGEAFQEQSGLMAFSVDDTTGDLIQRAADEIDAIDHLDDSTVDQVAEKQHRYRRFVDSDDQRRLRLAADAWVAAFVAPKTKNSPQITTATVNAALQDPDTIPGSLINQTERLAERFRFHHWHLAFPHVFAGTDTNHDTGWAGGFDVVLGNPPWERVKLQEKEFFANSAPEIAKAPNKAARTRLINALRTASPSLWQAFQDAVHDAEAASHYLRTSGVYPLCGRGDVNTYTVFAEAMRTILGPIGRSGVIVPTGIATDDTTKFFFADLVEKNSLVSLFDFENRKAIFPGVHRSYKFCLLTVTGSARPVEEVEFCFFALDTSDLQDTHRHFTLTAEDFALLNPNTRNCPTFRSRRDADLAKKVYSTAGIAIDETSASGNPWGLRLLGMFHMSGDSDHFAMADQRGNADDLVPLYEAKMVDIADHRFADVVLSDSAVTRQGQSSELSHADHRDPDRLAIPRYWVPRSEVENRVSSSWPHQWLIGWRDVTSATNARTLISGVIPRVGAGDKFSLALPEAQPRMSGCLAANLWSFALDFFARQKASATSLKFFVFRQLPVLPPMTYRRGSPWDCAVHLRDWIDDRAVELVSTAHDMMGFSTDLGHGGRTWQWTRERRRLLLAEIDAAFFHLYGLDPADVDYIMETFPIVKRKDIAEHGSYRTKELILDVYDRMAKAIETGEPYQTILDPPPADPSLCHPPRSREGD